MLLFVYGTLRSGFDNTFRKLMESQSTFVSLASIRGKLYDLGTYPGLILCNESSHLVHGELYQLHNRDLIKELDLYENYRRNDPGSLYIRSIETVLTAQGNAVQAVVYTYNKSIETAKWIESGDYQQYLRSKNH